MEQDEHSLDVLIDFINLENSENAVRDFNFFFKNLLDDIPTQIDWARLIYTDEVAQDILNRFLDIYREGILANEDSFYHLIYNVFDMMSDGLLEPSVFDSFFQKLRVPELRALFHHFATHNGELYARHLLKYLLPNELLREGEPDYPDYLQNISDLSHYFEDPDFITQNRVLLNAAYDEMLHKLIENPYVATPLNILLNRSFDYFDNRDVLALEHGIYKNWETGRIDIPEYGNNIASWVDYIDRIFGPFLASGDSREEIYQDIVLQFELRQAKDELDTVERAQKAINQEIFEDIAEKVTEYINPHTALYITKTVDNILESTEESELSPNELNKQWYRMLDEALQYIISDDPQIQVSITLEQYGEILEILYPHHKTLTQIVMDAFMAQDVTLREKLALRNLSRYRQESDPELEEFPLMS